MDISMLGLVLVVAALVLWIAALSDIARETRADGTMKGVWILIVIIAPVLGAILWFAVGKPKPAQ